MSKLTNEEQVKLIQDFDEEFGPMIGSTATEYIRSNRRRDWWLAQIDRIVEERDMKAKEELLADMKEVMRHWHGTGPMMVEDYQKQINARNETKEA